MEIQSTTLIFIIFSLFFTFQLVRFTDRLNDLSSKIPNNVTDEINSLRNTNTMFRDTIMKRLNQVVDNSSNQSEYNRSFINNKINTIENEILNNRDLNNLNYAEINRILANLTTRPYVSAEDLNTNLDIILDHINIVQNETREINQAGQTKIMGDMVDYAMLNLVGQIGLEETINTGQTTLGDSIDEASQLNLAGQTTLGDSIDEASQLNLDGPSIEENFRAEDIEGGINYCPLVNNQAFDVYQSCRTNNFYNSKIISDDRNCMKGYKYIYDYTNNRYDCVKCDAVENSLNYDCRPINNDYTVPNIEYVSYPITCMDGYTVSGNECISDGSDISYPECGDGYYQINNGKCINCPLLDGVETTNCYSFNGEYNSELIFDNLTCSAGYEILNTDNILFKKCMKFINDSDFDDDGKISSDTFYQIINNPLFINGLVYVDKTTSNNCNLGTFYQNIEANDETDKIYKLCYMSISEDIFNKIDGGESILEENPIFANKLINRETDFCKVIPYTYQYGLNNTLCYENKNTSSFITTYQQRLVEEGGEICHPGFYPDREGWGLGLIYEASECKKCERKSNAFTVECSSGYSSWATECFDGYDLIDGECVCQGTCQNYDVLSCDAGDFRDRDGTCKSCSNHLILGDNPSNYFSIDECIPVNYAPDVSYVLPTRFTCNSDSQHIRLDHEMCVKKNKPSLDTDQPEIYLATEEEPVCGTTQDGVDVLQLRNSSGDYLFNTLIGDKITTSGNNIDYEPVKVCLYNTLQTPCDRTEESTHPPHCEDLRSLYRGVADYFSR